MLTKLSSRPEVFNHLDNKHLWFKLCFDNCACEYGYMALFFKHDEGLIHIEITRWSISVVRQAKKDWKKVTELCKHNGCKTLIGVNPNPEDKIRWGKFLKLFGFPSPKTVMVSQLEI